MSAKPEFDLFATGSQTTAQKEASLEQLARRLVLDYYGTAMCGGFPMAAVELSAAERMNGCQIIAEAHRLGLI